MKILITGGAGYIGSALTSALSNNQNIKEIIVYDTLERSDYGLFTQSKLSQKVKFINANILDQHSLAQAMENTDVLYHLAAKVASPDSDNDSQYFEQTNNWGTSIVVNEAKKANVKHFIYLSSVYVYGQDQKIKTAQDIPNPNSFYGISKLRGEEHLINLPSSTKSHIIRSGSVYGISPATRFDVLVNKFLFESHFFKKIIIHGEGNQIRPFIHIDKLTESLASIPDSMLPNGTYNAVEHNISVNDIVEQLSKKYPELEYNHVNRHISMKDIIVEPSKEIASYIPWTNKSFEEELNDFTKNLWS